MALLTSMSLPEAEALGALFGLRVVGLEPVVHGSVNSNFAAELEGGGKVFLRVCEESDHAAVAAQNRLLAHLVAAGIPTPAPLERKDGQGTVAAHSGRPVSVFGWCEGAWICQERVTPRHLERVGEVLAALHRAGEGYEGAPVSRFDVQALAARLAGLEDQSLPEDVARDVAMLRERLAAVGEGPSPPAAPTVIHGDVFRDNVLWREDGSLSAVLDFESASLGEPTFDLMVTLLAWCYGDALEQGLARALLAGYQRERALSAEELAACHGYACLAALRFAITRITDYELRPRGVVAYKDYRRFTGRLAALDAIGVDAFAAWLTG